MALVILLIISIVCTSIERARVESANARCRQITYLALDSCFSGYGREIFEEYGLMMLWENEQQFLDEYENYVDKNCNYRKDVISKPADFLKINYSDTELISISESTDSDGELIERQICDYMKLALPESVIDEILNNSKTISQSKGISEFNEKIDECSESMTSVEDCVEGIYDTAEELKNNEVDPMELIIEMKDKISVIKSTFSEEKMEVDIEKEYADFLNKYNEFNAYILSTDKRLQTIMTLSNDYLINSDNAIDNVGNVKSYIASKEGYYQKDILDSLMGEINDIESEILDVQKDNYNVNKNKDKVIEQRKIIFDIKQKFEAVEKKINSNSHLSLLEISEYEKFVEEISLAIDEVLPLVETLKLDNIDINYEKKAGKEVKNEIVEFVEKIKSEGVINYVVAGDISNKSVNINNLPSNVCKVNNGKGWKNYGVTEENIRKAMVGQYVFDNFSCYTKGNEGECLNYEIEYILKGKSSDKENLSEVIDEILLIREGFNLIYLFGDSEKRGQAYTMATAVTGFTGMPVVIRLTQMLIMAAWAYAESIIDVKDLLEGKRVSIIKTSNEWNLSLMGVKNLAPKKDKKQNNTGLLYEDYIRVLLFSQNKALQIYRILDVIELNMSKKYNNSFKIRDCIVNVNIKSDFKIDRLFTEIGFVKGMIKNKKKGFIFEINQEYGY
ncbi:MAG: hypothetical protein IJA34_11055 [Lachnospiraceae bacterium]|nr:hypothetical protein [Lachnospiraceae bacterium]